MIQNYLVKIGALSGYKGQSTVLAVFTEGDSHSDRVVVGLAQKQFCFFVEAIIVSNPLEPEDALLQGLADGNAANGIGVGSCKGFDLVLLEHSVFIVEGFGGSWPGSGGDVVKVLELPVGPAPEVHLHQVSQDGNFFGTFGGS